MENAAGIGLREVHLGSRPELSRGCAIQSGRGFLRCGRSNPSVGPTAVSTIERAGGRTLL
jgi:hypothetical protein